MEIEPFSPVLPNPALITSADTFFDVVKEDYLDYRRKGMFVDAGDAGYYVYHLREGDNTYLGLICGVPARLYREGFVRQHEGTLAASEQQQLQLLVLREAVVKPVLLSYPVIDEIESLLETVAKTSSPVLELDDGPLIKHRLFEVSPESDGGARLRKMFAEEVPHVYIADGHHRCSSLELYNKRLEQRGERGVPLLAALFSSRQVRVRAYHRVLQLPVDLSPLALMARLSELFEVQPLTEPTLPEARHELTLLLQDEAFRLRWRPAMLEGEGLHLDAGLFNALVSGPIFGIADIRTDSRIIYVPGITGVRNVLNRVQRRPDRVGFMLYGLEAEDMFAVVDAGEIMPPKSTWFEPRMRNGLTVMEL